jgi:hypothetical protein
MVHASTWGHRDVTDQNYAEPTVVNDDVEPEYGGLPQRPAEASDAELAEVIRRLPGPMAAAAIAAGVLGEQAQTDPEMLHGLETPGGTGEAWPQVPVSYPARPFGSQQPAVAESGSQAGVPRGQGVALTHPRRPAVALTHPTPRPASQPAITSGGQRASSGATTAGRGATGAASSGSRTTAAGASAAAAGLARAPIQRHEPEEADTGAATTNRQAAAASEQELDDLADEIFGRIRWRLAAERERFMA